MQNLDDFNNRIKGTDYYFYRNNFRESYTFLEKYCKENFKNKNVHICLPQKINFIEIAEILKELKKIIELDYIKDNNYGFDINPNVKKSTDLLREYFNSENINYASDDEYNKSLFVLLKQVRDNLTHDGKFELEDLQFKRNYEIIKIASEITDKIIEVLKKYGCQQRF